MEQYSAFQRWLFMWACFLKFSLVEALQQSRKGIYRDEQSVCLASLAITFALPLRSLHCHIVLHIPTRWRVVLQFFVLEYQRMWESWVQFYFMLFFFLKWHQKWFLTLFWCWGCLLMILCWTLVDFSGLPCVVWVCSKSDRLNPVQQVHACEDFGVFVWG